MGKTNIGGNEMKDNEQFLKGRESKAKEMEYDIEKTYNKAIDDAIEIVREDIYKDRVDLAVLIHTASLVERLTKLKGGNEKEIR